MWAADALFLCGSWASCSFYSIILYSSLEVCYENELYKFTLLAYDIWHSLPIRHSAPNSVPFRPKIVWPPRLKSRTTSCLPGRSHTSCSLPAPRAFRRACVLITTVYSVSLVISAWLVDSVAWMPVVTTESNLNEYCARITRVNNQHRTDRKRTWWPKALKTFHSPKR